MRSDYTSSSRGGKLTLRIRSLLLGALFALPFLHPAPAIATPPSPVHDVFKYGAKGNGLTKDTASIQAAIDACAGTGGSVWLHDGKFLSGMIRLKSNMTFYIDASATLLGATDDADYPKTIPNTRNINAQTGLWRGLIHSEGADNLTITGGGTIDGQGDIPKWRMNGGETKRPVLVYLTLGKHIEVSNLKLRRSAMWTFVPLECDYLTIRNIDINCNLFGNRDGIDPCDCQHVLIENCTFFTDDDAICFKSGHPRGVSDVIVRKCTILKSERASGIKFGTIGYGGFRNMLFEDITINDVDKGGISVESVDGAGISNVTFRRIKMTDVGAPIFIILGNRGTTPKGGPRKIGSVDGITFEDVTARNVKSPWGCAIAGMKVDSVARKVKNITFRRMDCVFKDGLTTSPPAPGENLGPYGYPECNMWGNLPAYGYYVRHAENVRFIDCKTSCCESPGVRPAILTSDATWSSATTSEPLP